MSDVTTGEGASSTDAPQRLGRYLVIEQIGSGGMGVVYKAYDPDLDRKVALKLLHAESRAGESIGDAHSRLVREAQAMARLSHPNVVPVHDVGISSGQLFVAMEYVAGRTLRQWLEDAKRSSRAIIDRFREAGRGLAAAHKAGVLHRDFKSDNVLIDDDGRAKVTDFGLARLVDDETSPSSATVGASEPAAVPDAPQGERLTRAGAVMGTPAYMAAEQFLGQPLDVRTEQFNFCASLWEALYGERAFAGKTFAELAFSVTMGKLRSAPAMPGIPPYVRRALERGLALDRSQRFDSLEALLEAISIDPWRRRKAALAIGVAVVALVGTGLAVASIAGQSDPCAASGDRVVATWNDIARAGVRRAFTATGHLKPEVTFTLVDKNLSTYAAALGRVRRDVCEATHVRGEQSERLLDLKIRCLDRRHVELSALVQLFGRAPDPQLVDQAVQAATQLTPLAVCADAQVLESVVPLPEHPALRAQVESLRAVLAAAKAEDDSGRYKSALELLTKMRPEVESARYPPLGAELLYRIGLAQERSSDHTAAEATYLAAAKLAADANDDLLAAQIWTELVAAIGALAGRTDEGLAFAAAADAALIRARAPPALRAQLAFHLGNLYSVKGDARAVASQELALRLREEAFGRSHPALAEALGAVGARYREAGRLDEAEAVLNRSIAMYADELGHDHPQIIRSMIQLGSVYYMKKDFARALSTYEETRALAERLLGEDHRHTLAAIVNIGNLQADLGRLDEAKATLLAAVVLLERQNNRYWTGQTARSLAELHAAQELWDGAAHWARKAVENFEGGNEAEVARCLTRLAHFELARGNAGAAITAGQRAVDLHERNKSDPSELAGSRFQLGRALYAAGRDRAEARRLIELGRMDTKDPQVRGQIDAWLTKH